MLHPKVREQVLPLIRVPYEFPADIIAALKNEETTWRNYENFPEAYKRIRVAYIDAARKRPKEYEKRLNHFLSKTKENKLILGYGGIEKYFDGSIS